MKRSFSAGFLGTGKMGSAILAGILDARLVPASRLRVFDVDRARTDALTRKLGVRFASQEELVDACDIVFLCVKPDQFRAALTPLAPRFGKRHTLVSIMAGVPIASIRSVLGDGIPVIRVMPNVAAMVGQGVAAVARGPGVAKQQADFVTAVFEALGGAVSVPEAKMDAVTALSGSGPAYVFMVIEALIDAGVLMGIDRQTSTRLAVQTVLGSAALMKQTGRPASELRGDVSSPGGTTIAGTTVLERRAFRGILMDAVAAAWNRSRELGAS